MKKSVVLFFVFFLISGCISSPENISNESTSDAEDNEPDIPYISIGIKDHPPGPPLIIHTGDTFTVIVNIPENDMDGNPLPGLFDVSRFLCSFEYDPGKINVNSIKVSDMINNKGWTVDYNFNKNGTVSISASGIGINGHGDLIEIECTAVPGSGGDCFFVIRGEAVKRLENNKSSYSGFLFDSKGKNIITGSDFPAFLEISNHIIITPDSAQICSANYKTNKILLGLPDNTELTDSPVTGTLKISKNSEELFYADDYTIFYWPVFKINLFKEENFYPGDILKIEFTSDDFLFVTPEYTVPELHAYPLDLETNMGDLIFTEFSICDNEDYTLNSGKNYILDYNLNIKGPVLLNIFIINMEHNMMWNEQFLKKPPYEGVNIFIDPSWPPGDYFIDCVAEFIYDFTRTTETSGHIEFVIEN